MLHVMRRRLGIETKRNQEANVKGTDMPTHTMGRLTHTHTHETRVDAPRTPDLYTLIRERYWSEELYNRTFTLDHAANIPRRLRGVRGHVLRLLRRGDGMHGRVPALRYGAIPRALQTYVCLVEVCVGGGEGRGWECQRDSSVCGCGCL